MPTNSLDLISRRLDEQQAALQASQEVAASIADWAGDTTAAMAALQMIARALIATHPEPEKLANVFHELMDEAADHLPACQIEIHRSQIEPFHFEILKAVSTQRLAKR